MLIRTTIRHVAVLAVLFGYSAPASAAELVMLEQAGCHYCDRWDDEVGVVYHKTKEGKEAPLRRVDIHQPLPADLANLNTGNFTPTFVLMDGGKEVGRIRGYPGDDFFWGLLTQMMEKLPTLDDKAS